MRWTLVKAGGRRFRCLDCDGEYPLKSPDVTKMPDLKPPESSSVTL